MAIEFRKYDAITHEAWENSELLAIIHVDQVRSVFMLLNYCSLENGEQILSKMKELHSEVVK